MPKTTRRESRETAFALLFEWSFHEGSLDEIIELAKIARDINIDDFSLKLAASVIENREELDLLIERYSQGWKLRRISRTALSVLRMSICEMTKFDDIPVGASINEAVELVKKFGTLEEAAYINGILGSFERVRKGLAEKPKIIEKENEQLKQYELQDIHTENTPQETPDDIELVEDIIIEVE